MPSKHDGAGNLGVAGRYAGVVLCNPTERGWPMLFVDDGFARATGERPARIAVISAPCPASGQSWV